MTPTKQLPPDVPANAASNQPFEGEVMERSDFINRQFIESQAGTDVAMALFRLGVQYFKEDLKRRRWYRAWRELWFAIRWFGRAWCDLRADVNYWAKTEEDAKRPWEKR